MLHKTYAERLPSLTALYLETDSAALFSHISAIRRLAEENDDDDLLAETRLLRAHYFFAKNYPKDIRVPMLDSLVQMGRRENRRWLELMATNMLALSYFYAWEEYERAFELHRRVYDMLKTTTTEYFPNKRYVYAQIADEYYYFSDYRQSIFHNLLALKAHSPYAFQPPGPEPGILNNLGLCYQKLGKLDSAKFYFEQVLNSARRNGSEQWEGIARGNLGNNLYLQKNYDAAVPLLENDVRIAVKYRDWGLASGSQMILANISLLRGDIASAAKQIPAAHEYVRRSGQYQRYQNLYPLLARWHALQNHPGLSAAYLDSAIMVRDSLNRKFNALHIARAMQRAEMERHRAELENIEVRRSHNILQRNVLIGVVVLLMTGTVIYYRAQRRRAVRQEQELFDASRQLDDFARNISEKNSLISMLEQHAGADPQALAELQQSTILTDSDWAHFRSLFEKVHHGYLQRLREKLPGLTPAETRFMALSKLGLSTREMAAMLGIGTDTIRQHRSRLRKKLNLSEEGSLEELASQV